MITLTTGQSFDLSHCVHSEPAAVLLGPRIGLNGQVLEGEGECIVAGRGRLGVTKRCPPGSAGNQEFISGYETMDVGKHRAYIILYPNLWRFITKVAAITSTAPGPRAALYTKRCSESPWEKPRNMSYI